MLRSLSSGVSAMEQFQQSLDVIGNNIANVNTTGFKSARVDFADSLGQTLSKNGAGVSMQVGTGVTTSNIANQFTTGAINTTGTPTDLAISGGGFFIVRDPISNEQFVTRSGDFQLDSEGFLVTPSGMRAQGYSDSGLTTMGDLQVDATGAPSGSTGSVRDYSFSTDGKLTVVLSDGSSFTRGQVLLQNFRSPQSLIKEGNNLYSGVTGAGPLDQPSAPRSNGLGFIVGSSLEASNVDLANEFAKMITAQRGFQASARVITTSDEVLQELVNLKR
jgi:flagellar hook protein FlgE